MALVRGRSLLAVVDTQRGTKRTAREARQAWFRGAGAPRNRGIFDPTLLRGALGPALRKLDPRQLMHNPVMFVVEVTALLVTVVFVSGLVGVSQGAPREVGRSPGFELQIAIWLWFTVYFATYAEALAEARGKAQAATLRKTRSETVAHRRLPSGVLEDVGSSDLRSGDVVVIREGEIIPGDGDVIEGVAYVNEAVITGESACEFPVVLCLGHRAALPPGGYRVVGRPSHPRRFRLSSPVLPCRKDRRA
jgi:K+-transporting ATPase ATPase B chain